MKSNKANVRIRAQTSATESSKIDKLCFTTSLNTDFIPGAVATIRSIRKYYSPVEADIVVFLDRKPFNFSKLCEEYSVELQYFDDIASWALPLVYDDPKRLGDTTHYYHPKFQPVDGLPFNMDGDPGFDRIRHLHPLNVKAYCTGYSLCVRKYRRVVHIDCDAFLLARIDEMFEKHAAPNSVIAFDDGYESLQNFERLFRMPKCSRRQTWSCPAAITNAAESFPPSTQGAELVSAPNPNSRISITEFQQLNIDKYFPTLLTIVSNKCFN